LLGGSESTSFVTAACKILREVKLVKFLTAMHKPGIKAKLHGVRRLIDSLDKLLLSLFPRVQKIE
jgi:hypothetical protein